ncbi:Ribulose bisphosphate carboxylase [Durusdinium trenchii]|uniref:Chloroplastic (RuBisCO) n=1 Tax=Durusdinium trenchii TaxID=1381693 RepID=A0ABP0IBM2_9DINO
MPTLAVLLCGGVSFVTPGSLQSSMSRTPTTSTQTSQMEGPGLSVAGLASCGALALAAAVGLRSRRADRVARNYTSFKRVDYADYEYTNDVGYLPDGTPMNRAGNAINHPEQIPADPHAPGSPLPRANYLNSVGYLPDGTAMNAAGNALNHPETMTAYTHAPGSPLPVSAYQADIGYFVDGTALDAAGNALNHSGSAPTSMPTVASPSPAAPPAFTGSSSPVAASVRHPGGFAYSLQKDAYADLSYFNDVGYLPDGTPLNRAGNAINHPEQIQADPHAPGSPLPRAIFANDVGYLPDGTPMNQAGNAINHPGSIQPDPHSPGSALPASAYSADVGYLVDGTPMDAAGNNSVHG